MFYGAPTDDEDPVQSRDREYRPDPLVTPDDVHGFKWPWQICFARSRWEERCDRKRGHEGWHYVDRTFNRYWFDQDERRR